MQFLVSPVSFRSPVPCMPLPISAPCCFVVVIDGNYLLMVFVDGILGYFTIRFAKVWACFFLIQLTADVTTNVLLSSLMLLNPYIS